MIRNLSMVFIGLIVLSVAGCVQGPQGGAPGAGTGRAVFTLADAAADMGAISSVKVTVDSVMAHNAAQGWVTVSSVPKTYDLLQLNATGKQVLLADVQLQPGTYEQVRLVISKVMVTDDTGEHEAKLPSGDLKIVGGFDVAANTTSAVMFDFIADESLHVTGNGEYIMAPVIRLQTVENASVDASDENDVEVAGGRVKTDVKVGMDINGNVAAGSGIPVNAAVSIVNGVLVVTPPAENRTDETPPAHPGSANYQNCVSNCLPGNEGNGSFCRDGCRAEEGARTEDTYWCDQLDNLPNIPSCYGTVAKTNGDLTLCLKFSGTDKDHCVAAFGSTSAD